MHWTSCRKNQTESQKKKFERVKSQLEKRFNEVITPEQSEELISQILHNKDFKEGNTEPIPEELVVPVKMFKESEFFGKLFVVALPIMPNIPRSV